MARRPTGTEPDDGVRYGTVLEDGEVYVQTAEGLLWVAPVEPLLEAVGGPAWTIAYSDWERTRYPDLDTSDEGLTVSVRDIVAAMEHDERFVETLQAMPADARTSEGGEVGGVAAVENDAEDGDPDLSPRAGLFVGKLLENLQSGVD